MLVHNEVNIGLNSSTVDQLREKRRVILAEREDNRTSQNDLYTKKIERIISLINESILLDHFPEDEKEHEELYGSIQFFNKKLDYVRHLGQKTWLVAGMLNFRVHNYDKAIIWLGNSIDSERIFSLRINEEMLHDGFIKRLLLAYCHEYSLDPFCALKVVIGENNGILDKMLICRKQEVRSATTSKNGVFFCNSHNSECSGCQRKKTIGSNTLQFLNTIYTKINNANSNLNEVLKIFLSVEDKESLVRACSHYLIET